MEIIDDVPFEEAKAKTASGEYALMVDRMLATQAFGNSGSPLTHLVFLPYLCFIVAVVMLFFDWRYSIGLAIAGFFAFRLLRTVAINWVRKNALIDRGLYGAFAKHRIVWFTPTQR